MLIEGQIENVNDCIICNTRNTAADNLLSGSLGLVKPYEIKKCCTCGLRWLSPRPTQKAYESIYSYESYFEGNNAVESYTKISSDRVYYFSERIKKIEKTLNKKSLTILDIGSATGEFVQCCIKRGHTAIGQEFSSDARRVAKNKYGIELIGQNLEDMKFKNNFDVVHMNHVFEHLLDPVQAVNICKSFLKENGIFVLEIPQEINNDLDLLKKILGLRRIPEFNAYSLHHTYFYSPKTITLVLEQNGFKVKSLRTSNPARTPLFPFSLKNLLLRIYLWLSDFIHHGGNIIEIYAEKIK